MMGRSPILARRRGGTRSRPPTQPLGWAVGRWKATRSRRCLARIGLLTLIGFAIIASGSTPAAASMTGPCTATVNGSDVGALSASSPSSAIRVEKSDTLSAQAQSSGSVGSYRIQLEYAGIRWTVAKGEADNNSWSRDVKVADYARYGAGLYRVHGVSTGAAACDGSVLIRVGGSPFATPAGLVGTGLVALGVANAASMLRRGRKVLLP